MRPTQSPGPSAALRAETTGARATPPEDRLSFWREDPLINEHHEHWHLVYPTSGHDTPCGGKKLGDRQGELFAYMHTQMLARYDAERSAVGIPRVEPFSGYRDSIPQGYDPGDLTRWVDGEWYRYRARPEDATLSDLTLNEEGTGGIDWSSRAGSKLSDMERFRDRLLEAAESGTFETPKGKTTVSIDNLGATVEATIGSVDHPGRTTYGNVHNDGHLHFMLFDNTLPYGVMVDPATAIRDPVFFRWHKHIDDFFYQWQQSQPPNDLSNGPKVKIRKGTSPDGKVTCPDIILCLAGGLPAEFDGEKLGTPAYDQKLAAAAFGYSDDLNANAWDRDLASTTVALPGGAQVTTTGELITEMMQRTIHAEDESGAPAPEVIDYLAHDDFWYFIRAENLADQPQRVTVRVFLAPETEVDDRRSWIEMDKFSHNLAARQRAVIARSAELSSVIRKPALKPEDLNRADDHGRKTGQQSWCDCGWPYTLLLPRGTADGMEFRLLVLFSSGDDLIMPQHSEGCASGSVSYCGLQDENYPDRQPMGYPFDRRFADGLSISSAIMTYDNMASRTIKIRCRNL